MTRRTLDYIFASGGVALAVLFLVLGFVLADQASFAKDYVKDQLSQQKITFATVEELNADKTANPTNPVGEWKPGSVCLTANAGELMTTGKQAECYANFYIGMHTGRSAKGAGFEGATYATLGPIRTGLTADIAAAKTANDTAKAADLQKRLDSATSLRSTMQTGETLRGLLLTSYGFSIFGEKAALAGTVCYIVGALLLVLGAAGFIHAFMTPKEKTVLVPAPTGTVPGGLPRGS